MTMITPSYLGETIEYSSLHACRSTLEDPTGMQQAAQKMGKSGSCVAALVYVYDHAARDLSRRLVENYHGHHDLSMATLHVHLDDDNCMEVTALKGTGAEVQHFADHVIAERGVRYGRLVMIPTEDGKKKAVAHKKAGHRHP